MLIFSFFYAFGHVIASLSAFILDRNLIGRCIKYPYRNFLILCNTEPVGNNSFFKERFVVRLVLFNAILLIFLFLNFNICYFTFSIVALIIVTRIKKLTIWFFNKIKFYLNKLGDFLYIKPNFSEDFRKELTNLYKELKLEPDKYGTFIYWYTRNYIMEKSPTFNQMLINWFNLYSFARNLSTSCYLAYLYVIILLFGHFTLYPDSSFYKQFYSWHIPTSFWYKFFLIILFTISIILLFRFYYLYYIYYNRYLFRTFYYLKKEEERIKT